MHRGCSGEGTVLLQVTREKMASMWCGYHSMRVPRPMWSCSSGEGLALSLSGEAPGQAAQSYDGTQKSDTVRDALAYHRQACSGTGSN